MRQLYVIGLNSGTSMDGIDAALFSIAPSANPETTNGLAPALETELVHSLLYPFDKQFQRRLQATVASTAITWENACLLNTALGELFADAALRLIRESRDRVERVDLIGSHGQTLWHSPLEKNFWGVRTSGTLQLGEPSVIAARTDIPVVADFRAADMAMGGEGAPLVSFADQVLFGHSGVATGVLNLGGIANITALDLTGAAIMAFDTGPGNMLIDKAMSTLFNQDFDDRGAVARSGKVDQQWLQILMSNPYFERVPPKTTGREQFGFACANAALEQAQQRGIKGADVIATLTALSTESIARAYERFVLPRVQIERLIIGGGGGENIVLMDGLAARWPHPIKIFPHEKYGISTKFKEALLFALLAYTTYFNVPNNVPACTGASRRVCLGKIVPAFARS
jgi:anhydro-N-acetylmuramic acid kinase